MTFSVKRGGEWSGLHSTPGDCNHQKSLRKVGTHLVPYNYDAVHRNGNLILFYKLL